MVKSKYWGPLQKYDKQVHGRFGNAITNTGTHVLPRYLLSSFVSCICAKVATIKATKVTVTTEARASHAPVVVATMEQNERNKVVAHVPSSLGPVIDPLVLLWTAAKSREDINTSSCNPLQALETFSSLQDLQHGGRDGPEVRSDLTVAGIEVTPESRAILFAQVESVLDAVKSPEAMAAFKLADYYKSSAEITALGEGVEETSKKSARRRKKTSKKSVKRRKKMPSPQK
jgi:hypothetical protein